MGGGLARYRADWGLGARLTCKPQLRLPASSNRLRRGWPNQQEISGTSCAHETTHLQDRLTSAEVEGELVDRCSDLDHGDITRQWLPPPSTTLTLRQSPSRTAALWLTNQDDR